MKSVSDMNDEQPGHNGEHQLLIVILRRFSYDHQRFTNAGVRMTTAERAFNRMKLKTRPATTLPPNQPQMNSGTESVVSRPKPLSTTNGDHNAPKALETTMASSRMR